MGFGHAHGQLAPAGLLEPPELARRGGFEDHVGPAVDPGDDGPRLVFQGIRQTVCALGDARLGQRLHDGVGEIERPLSPAAEVVGEDDVDAEVGHGLADGGDLGLRIRGKPVDRHEHALGEDLREILAVAAQVDRARADRGGVLLL